VQRRTIWCPTWLGLFCAFVLVFLPIGWWCTCGESFLSLTRRLPPEVLVVEGWIGYDGIRAAAAEFKQHGYQYVVATGGLTYERWNQDRSSFAEMAQHELIRSGVAPDRIIMAPADNHETQRTYESAVAVFRALEAKGVHPNALNVFTFGPHARRSRLVFAKVFGPRTAVGVVNWTEPGFQTLPWWRSSERARELLTETAGYLYETLFNSGRPSNSPHKSQTGSARAEICAGDGGWA
jgi:uncharacterized SAM-binding protein YcdF (DUF218 family)